MQFFDSKARFKITEESKLSMGTMTKKKLISAISQERGVNPTDVRNVVQSFLDKLTEALSCGDRLEFRDFGVFEVVLRKQKIGRNPKNASVPIVIPARYAVKFTPGKKMRKMIEESDSMIAETETTTMTTGLGSTTMSPWGNGN